MLSSPPAPAQRLTDAILDVAGDSVAAVLLYGSQLLRASPSPDSAWDLVVVVDSYGPFHEAFSRGGLTSRPPVLLNLLGGVLPPSVTALVPDEWPAGPREAPIGKCAIVSLAHFRRALMPGSPDHFLKGRMVQRVGLLWSRNDRIEASIEGWLRMARRDVLNWAGPWLDEPFDAHSVPRRMLRVSYSGELRPESGGRADEIYEAQADWLTKAYAEVLREAESDGEVVAIGAEIGGDRGHTRYRFARPRGGWARLRTRLYFTKSKVRATLRWFKHILTFDDWLGYLLRKVERRTGERVELTAPERTLPLIFLWPRVFHFFLSGKHRKRRSSDDDPGTK